MFKSKLLVEEHLHGAFGVYFNTASVEDMIYISKELLKCGIGGYFPTIVTDSVENTARQIKIIKEASTKITKECAEILGIHIEGIFINKEKKGIHNPAHFLPLTVENYQKIEDDFIKIVTLAPELDEGLIDYLNSKNIKVHAGHCIGGDLSKCSAATHLFNAMSGVVHRGKTTALSALINDNLYTEIIADGIHLSDDILRLILKSKPLNKVILISDALPITYSNLKETLFADEKIYYDGERATSSEGTIAGSTTLLDKIVKILARKNMFNPQLINNVYEYHNINIDGEIIWDDSCDIASIKKGTYKITGKKYA